MIIAEKSWPVFKLPRGKPQREGNVLYYLVELIDEKSRKVVRKLEILDDTNLPQQTLGLRRLHLKGELAKLPNAIYFLSDLIKLTSGKNGWFIDSSGSVFQYIKSRRVKLKCFEVDRLLPTNSTGSIVLVKGVTQRFKVMYTPDFQPRYAGLLIWGLGYMFYGFFDEHFKTTNRAI